MKEGHVNRLTDNSDDDQNKPKIMKLDLSSLESVKEFVKELVKVEPKIDLLINSANVFENQLILTRDGFEMMFQENYLSNKNEIQISI